MGDSSLGIIALVPDQWLGITTLRHQVLRRLAAYYPVVWVEPAADWRAFLQPRGADFLAADRWTEPVPSLEVVRNGFRHPRFYRPEWLRTASLKSRLSACRKRLLERGATRIALYLWRDEFAEALDLVPHEFSCYHVDDEYTFSDVDQPNSARETDLLRRVDRVIVHSPALFKKKGSLNPNTTIIPSGVDFHVFSQPEDEPADMVAIPHPRVGYAGVVKKQLDLDLLVRLARARPQYSFVLVGPDGNLQGKQQALAALQQLPNVYLLGGKPAERLHTYIQHFDVCLMCYEVNDYTQYINPLKLYEYLASSRPVVSAPIAIVQELGDIVSVANSDAEWLAAIDRAVNDPEDTARTVERRLAAARANDWDGLVERIAKLFCSSRESAPRTDPTPFRNDAALSGLSVDYSGMRHRARD